MNAHARRSTALLAAMCLWIYLIRSIGAATEQPESMKGITEPYRMLTIRSGGKRNPPWTMRIARIYVDEGSHVEPGQTLIEMDRSQEALDLKLKQVIAANVAELNGAKVKETTLAAIVKSARELYNNTKSISYEDLQHKQLDYDLAITDRQRLEYQKEREKVELAIAVDELARRTIRSPAKGTIVKVALREGENCEPNDPLLQMVDTSRGYIVANVEENLMRGLKVGDVVDLSLQTTTGSLAIPGTVSYVSPVVDPAGNLVTIKVEFQNADGQVRPGSPGYIKLRPGTH